MRAALLLVASTLAACREGIELEVIADDRTATVEVFMASRAGADVAAFAGITALGTENPDDAAPLVRGTLYPRDGATGDATAPFVATIGADRRGRLALEPSPDVATLPALIAVGFDANRAITSAAVLTDVDVSTTPVRLVVALAPVSHAVLDGAGPAAQVWGREATPGGAGCVGVTTAAGETRFIVREDDPDCDGFTQPPSAMDPANVECAPADYQGEAEATTEVLTTIDGTCREAKTGCVDGLGAVQGVATDVCYPDGLCALACAAGGLRACADAGLFTQPGGYARLVCDVPVNTSPAPALCSDQLGLSDLGQLFDGAQTCDKIEFAPLTLAGVGSFAPKLALVGPASNPSVVAAVAASTMLGTNVQTTCGLVITPPTAILGVDALLPPQVVQITASGGNVLQLPVVLKQVACAMVGASPITCRYEPGVGTGTDGVELCAD